MVIKINDVDINYEVFGDGKPLLLLHGWGACVNSMTPIWNFFKDKFKVFVLDFPGQGNKSGEPTYPWGIPEYAKMVKTFMQELKVEKPDVIAHSFGGRVTIYLASNYQELFNKIILVDAAGVKPKTSLKKKFRVAMFKCGKAFLKVTCKGDNYDIKLNKLRNKYGSSDYNSLKSDIMRKTFNNVVGLDLTKNLKDIKNSTLLMWGENDIVTPLYMAKTMEKNIPDSGLVVLKKAGHFSYIDSSNEFNIVANNFLGGN